MEKVKFLYENSDNDARRSVYEVTVSVCTLKEDSDQNSGQNNTRIIL